MKKWLFLLLLSFLLAGSAFQAGAQCSICTKTAQQLGEKPAKSLNSGILYLAAMPFLVVSYIGYRWWRSNRDF